MNIFDLQATIGLNGEAFMKGVEQAQSAFDGFNSTISSGAVALGNVIADMVTSAAGALKNFAGSIVDTGMEFGASMSNVKAISGATNEEFEALTAKAQEMGATTKFTASQAADAFSYMAMAGWDAEQMMSGIEGIMNLAAASGADLATTSDIVTDALTAFGLKAEDSAHFADVLAAASSAANTNVEMMGETFKYVAPVAGALNYSIEDMATAIGTMANSGIKGSQAGTSLRSALSRLVDPTKEVNEALNALGLILHTELPEGFEFDTSQFVDELAAAQKASDDLAKAQADYSAVLAENGYESEKTAKAYEKVTKAQQKLEKANRKLKEKQDEQINAVTSYNAAILDQNGNTRDFSDTISILRDAFSDLSDAEKAQYASQIFGQQAMSGMLALLNTSTEEYSALAGTIASASFDMDAFTEGVKNSGVEWDKYADKVWEIEGLVDEAASALSRGFSAEEVADYLHFEYDLDTSDAIAAVEALQQAMEDSAGTSERMANIMQDNLAGAQTLFESALDGFKLSLYTYLEEPLRDLTELGTGILSDFTTEINENGIGGAFSALGDILQNRLNPYLDDLKSKLDFGDVDTSSFSAISESAQNLIGSIAKAGELQIQDGVAVVRDFVGAFENAGGSEVVADIAKSSGELFETIMSASADVISAVSAETHEFVEGFLESNAAESIADAAVSAGELFETFNNTSAKVIDAAGDATVRFLDGVNSHEVGESFGEFVEATGELAKASNEFAAQALEDAGEAVKVFTENADIEGAGEGVGKLASSILDLGTATAGSVAEDINTFAEATKGMGERTAEVAAVYGPNVGRISSAAGRLVSTLTDAATRIETAFKPVREFFINNLMPIFEKGLDMVIAFAGGLERTISAIANLFSDELAVAMDIFSGDWDQLWKDVEQAWEDVKELFWGITDTIVKPFEAIDLFETGKNMIMGLWDGVTGAWDDFTSWLDEKVHSGLIGSVMDWLGIASPSKVFAGIGKNTVLGMEVGWEDEFGNMEREVQDSISGLTGTARIGFDASAIGRSSAAGITSMLMTNGEGGNGEPITINLVLDGDVAATVLYDPLRNVAFQRGHGQEVPA